MEPTTYDGINYKLEGCLLQVLTVNDIIQNGDFQRELHESGDEGGFNKTYKPNGWDGLAWHKVDDELSGWIGKTYKDYLEFGSIHDIDYCLSHEIVRVIDLPVIGQE
ncbi:hypothetical protein [Acinetobacter sp.]|uniref:hypothetical protein n=1 Tax=Acinetobacter sp. TaxID=472 RepID=UPI003CFBC555